MRARAIEIAACLRTNASAAFITLAAVKNMDVEDNRIEKGTFSTEIHGYTDTTTHTWYTTEVVVNGNEDYGFEFSDESSDTLVGNDLLHGLRASGSKLNQVVRNVARYVSITGGESNTLIGNRIIPANGAPINAGRTRLCAALTLHAAGMTLPDQENFEMVDNQGLHFMG